MDRIVISAVFRHNNILGSCPSHILFDKISVREKENVLPRAFGDYDIVLDENMPAGVELIQKL